MGGRAYLDPQESNEGMHDAIQPMLHVAGLSTEAKPDASHPHHCVIYLDCEEVVIPNKSYGRLILRQACAILRHERGRT
jgi:hypothetical protein